MKVRKVNKLNVFMMCVLGLIVLGACNNDIENNEVSYIPEELQEVEAHMDFLPLDDVWELVSISTHVMRVEVLDSRVEWVSEVQPRWATIEEMRAKGWPEEMIEQLSPESNVEPHPTLATIYRVQVLEVFHELDVFHETQAILGDIIEVARFGGIYAGHYWFISGAVTLEIGSEFVVFLNRHWERPHSFTISSTKRGAYRVPSTVVEDGDLVEYENLELELESVGENFEFTVTIEDLIEIAEKNDMLD